MNLYENALTELQKRKENNIEETDYEITKELLQQAIKNLENANYFLALTLLIEIYNRNKLECVINFIFQSYVIPNRDYFKKNYQKNVNLFNKYEHYYGENLSEKNEFKYEIIWINQQYLVLFDGNVFIKKDFLDKHISSVENNEVLDINELNYKFIITCDEKIPLNELNGRRTPIYLYYQQDYFEVALRIFDFQELLKKRRLVILCGKQYLEGFFEDYQALFPNKILGEGCNEINEILQNIYYKRSEIFRVAREEEERYYKENADIIIDNIKKGKPKILFFTSLFTTALQYHAKNMEKAARKMGCQTELLIEKSEIHRIFTDTLSIKMNEFRPDIVFLLDHFRYEQDKEINEAVVVVSWIQDPLSNIIDKNTPLKLGDRDFILNHYITWKTFFEIGYNKNHVIEGAIPGNQDVYKKYEITKEEKEKYSCDICILCHIKSIEDYINNDVDYIDGLEDKLKEIFYSYYKLVQSDDNMILYGLQEYKEFIKYSLISFYSIQASDKLIDFYAERMCYELNLIVFRKCLVDWLIEAGYTNIKLWGKGWENQDKYQPYAMGIAENGEVLSKIYQCSKIVLGNNIKTTGAARVWESMLSGAFYLSNWIPQDEDAVDIRKILKPEDFCMFKGKKDLLEKVNYYLTHEEERQEMIERGKEKALEKMTFDITCKRMIQALKEQL